MSSYPIVSHVAHVNTGKILHNQRVARTRKVAQNAHENALQTFSNKNSNLSKWKLPFEKAQKGILKGAIKVHVPGQTKKMKRVKLLTPSRSKSRSRSKTRSPSRRR